jgi:hypothetical protein
VAVTASGARRDRDSFAGAPEEIEKPFGEGSPPDMIAKDPDSFLGWVTSRKQAIAIGLSEARRSSAKVPKKKSSSSRKSSRKRSSSRKSSEEAIAAAAAASDLDVRDPSIGGGAIVFQLGSA